MAVLNTFVFTDIVGSVELKSQMPGRSDTERDRAFISTVLTPHRVRIEQHLASRGGRVVSTAGDGHFLVFGDTVQAVRWAVDIQESHRDQPLHATSTATVDVRISIHVGIPQIDPRDPNNFVGKPVDYAARLNDYATGRQVLVSRSVVAILEDAGMDGVKFHLHGRRELKGIGPIDVYELVCGEAGPQPTRRKPAETGSRQWTVLPDTMGISQYRAGPPAPTGDAPIQTGSATSTERQLGDYELGELLGCGGMGDVYRARHTQFGRVRAIKVIKQHLVGAGHQEVVRRFYQEIKAVGALEHPNIVVAIESSSPSDPVHFLVMEYLDGISVDELIKQRGPLGIADACEITRQAARGLDYIYQNAMVHRDMKPSNLMLTVVDREAGSSHNPVSPEHASAPQQWAVVNILDLGLALLVSDDAERLTRFADRAMGTGMYMAPEQWRTTSVDIRADIYSLGCTLYHMLSGEPPYAQSDLRPQRAHERAKLPPITVSREPVPKKLWTVLNKMTGKSPADRYQTPGEVAAALGPFAKVTNWQSWPPAINPQPATRPRRDRPEATPMPPPRPSPKPSWAARQDNGTSARPPTRRTVDPGGGLPAVSFVVLILALSWWAIDKGRRTSQGETDRIRQQNLRIAVNTAAREFADEIEQRFRILKAVADDEELRRMIQEFESATVSAAEAVDQQERQSLDAEKHNLQDTLQKSLAQAKINAEEYVGVAKSWFITDRRGVQIARSPESAKTLAARFNYRDYFHGHGRDFEEKDVTDDVEPIDSPHLSAVYQSKSDNSLKVAFSVPIEDGQRPPSVIGVLAMSVAFDGFITLEDDLLDGQEVVLINQGTDYLEDDQPRRGLILHHDSRGQFRPASPPRVGQPLLAQIDQVLAQSTESSNLPAWMLATYSDPAVSGGGQYWGAVSRVAERLRRTDSRMDTLQWVVLVQEPR